MSDEAYQRLLADNQRLRAEGLLLRRVLHLFAAPDDFELVFEGLMDAVLAHFDAQAGSLYMFDADSGALYFAAARGPKAAEVMGLDLTIAPGHGIAGACFENCEVIAVSDAHKDPRFSREVSEKVGYEVHSMLSAPIVADSQVLGVLQIMNKQNGSTFSPEEVQIAEAVGRYAGGLIGLGLELSDLHNQRSEEA
ncbi:MAG: GAF domain-containing protein [Planctomycetes bacterium]|nr:GAF domain-containing protein [Planctomycetota bacterium]